MAVLDDTVFADSEGSKHSLLLVSPFFGQVGTTQARYGLTGLSANAGKKLILTADVKTDIVRNDLVQRAYLELFANAEKMVSITCMDAWPKSIPLTGTSKGWQKLKAALIVEDSVKSVEVRLVFKGIGKVWIDNVKLEEARLAMPASMLKNGDFAASRTG